MVAAVWQHDSDWRRTGNQLRTSPTRTLTVSVFIRRDRDILQDLRPALLLCPIGTDGARGADSSTATWTPALPYFLVAPFLVVMLRLLVLLLLLLSYLCDVVFGVRVPGGAVEGVIAAVVPGLAEHVVGYLQTLVPGAGRLQQGQRLPPALRHLCNDAVCSPLPPSFIGQAM